MMLVLLLAACDKTYDGPPPSGDGAAVYGRVVGLLGAGLGDVEICPVDLDVDCAISAPDGDFLVEGLPHDSDIVVVMDKEDHLRTAFQHHTAVDEEWRKTLMTDALVEQMVGRVDVGIAPGLGHVMFILWSGPSYDDFDRVEGVSFSIDAADGSRAFYQAGGGMPDPDLTATSSSGSGGVFNVPPGDYMLSFEGGGVTCRPWFSHDFEPGDPVPVRVLADAASYLDLVCL